MKFFLKIVIIFIISNQCLALNIDDSIKSTIEKNPKVKIALENLNQFKELIIYSKGLKLPEITSSLSATYSNSDRTTTTSSSTPETLTDSYKLTITQNLYDAGFNNLEIERSKILFNNELINFKSTIQDLILDAINGYLTVINYDKSLEATKKNYESVAKAYEETKTRFELGSATLYDVQTSEASFASANTNLFAAEQNVIISKRSFERIVGLEPKDLSDVLNINTSIKLEDVSDSAVNNNLNLHLISNNIRIKEILYLKESKAQKPSLDLTGTGTYSNGSRLEEGTESTSGSIALTLTIPLYQGGQDASNIRKYKSQKLQEEINLEDATDELMILLANTFKDFKISEFKMASNLIIIKSIQTALTSLQEEYNLGTKTIKDLVEEEEKLLTANVNYLNSRKDYLLNYFKIKSLDGSLINIFDKYIPLTN